MNKAAGIVIAFCLTMALPGTAIAAPAPGAQENYQPLPAPGKKVPLGTGHYFTFGFDKKPKLGTCIMRVEIFTHDGQRDRSFAIVGDADMPSMRGAHSTGGKKFVLSAKGIYLLPMQIVMPGDWEIKLDISRNGQALFRGAYHFDI